MMLRLSPCVAATKASARSMPARRSKSWSMPLPSIVVPLKSGPRRLNAEDFTSRTVTSWSALVNCCASRAPTRPQPMMMTNVSRLPRMIELAPALTCRAGWSLGRAHERRRAGQPHAAWSVLEHIGRGMPQVELAELALVADAHDDQVDLAFEGFVDDCGAHVARL